MRFLKFSLSLLTAAALLSPIASDARTSRMMSVQTPSGKTVQLRTMRVRRNDDLGADVHGMRHVSRPLLTPELSFGPGSTETFFPLLFLQVIGFAFRRATNVDIGS